MAKKKVYISQPTSPNGMVIQIDQNLSKLPPSQDGRVKWSCLIKRVTTAFMTATAALMLLCLPGLIRALSTPRVGQISRFYRLTGQTPKSSKLISLRASVGSTTTSIDSMNNSLSEIFLTVEEEELFTTLQKVVVDESLGTTVRVAG